MAEGSHIYDVDGNDYLDFTLSQGPLILGHSHPNVLEAVAEYSSEGQLFAGQHIREIELAEKLNRLIPSAELMRFCLDGSCRCSKLLSGWQGLKQEGKNFFGLKDIIMAGWTMFVGEFPHLLPMRWVAGSIPNVYPWSQGLPEHSGEEFIILPWNDLELLKTTVAENYHEIAAIITEPIMCNNGCIVPAEGFLQGMREICDQYGIALIFDEVITGFAFPFRVHNNILMLNLIFPFLQKQWEVDIQ
jgi:glutamate-1-semialdehyde 2,1-aminomutase